MIKMLMVVRASAFVLSVLAVITFGEDVGPLVRAA